MNIPAPLAAALAAADEAYLIGLSNKGTVNRAKKDLASLSAPDVQVEGEGVSVKIGDAVCQIQAPLGESRCTCPSSGMCRHRITAILWLQQQAGPSPADDAPPPAPAFQQLRDYPPEKLAKQLGAKRLSSILFRYRSGAGPVITESSVVTVELPWLPATVRLLEPLEHSTCTCHSKAFCLHKAEALLFWQLSQGIVQPELLEAVGAAESPVDLDKLRGVCQAVCQTLAAQMATGLSRLPPGVCETVERMASLCHTAKLPDLERALRALHGEYAAYFARSATYRDTALLERLSKAFRLAAALETADEPAVRSLAGVFREDYELAGPLKLYLMGLRDVAGRGGYAGTIYYFWERTAHKFYTFSDVRPVFYEGSARRKPSAAPWGLPCTLRQAWNCGLDLTSAKATRAGGLSSTEQCSAVLLERQNPGRVFPAELLYTDFSRLLDEKSTPHTPEIRRLALICPHSCRIQAYDRVQQAFSLQLLDGAGRDLWLEVHYRKEEKKVVDMLEQLVRRLQRTPDLRPVFFAVVYREDDRLKCYPIEYFTDWEARP